MLAASAPSRRSSPCALGGRYGCRCRGRSGGVQRRTGGAVALADPAPVIRDRLGRGRAGRGSQEPGQPAQPRLPCVSGHRRSGRDSDSRTCPRGRRAMTDDLARTLRACLPWTPTPVPEDIPHGDMPGDQVSIAPSHIAKATRLFPLLVEKLLSALGERGAGRAVVAVAGGSGVGKSEIASL